MSFNVLFDEINHIFFLNILLLKKYLLLLFTFRILYSYINVIIKNVLKKLYDKFPIFLLQFNISNYKIIINYFMTKWNYPNYIEKDGIYIMYSMFIK